MTVLMGLTRRLYLLMTPMKVSSIWQLSAKGLSRHSGPEFFWSRLKECHNMRNLLWMGNLGSRISMLS